MSHPDERRPPARYAAGTSQAERLPPALLPTRLALDGRSLPELLAYAAQVSRCVAFYTSPDQPPAGTWALARHHDLLLLADIAAAPRAQSAADLAAHLAPLLAAHSSPAQQRDALRWLLDMLRACCVLLSNWLYDYARDARHQRLGPFAAALREALQALLPTLRQAATAESQLLAELGWAGPRRLSAAFVAHFGTGQIRLSPEPTATEDSYADEASPAELPEPALAPQPRSYYFERLAETLWRLHDAQLTVTHRARQTLHEELQFRNDQDPEMGLLVAFMQLYGHAQHEINAIPGRHLAYYYEQILQKNALPDTPDRTYFAFALAKGADAPPYRLPLGTVVDAGRDATGQRILFATTAEAELADWQVAVLATLLVARAPDLGREAPAVPRVTGVFAATLNEAQPGVGLGPVAVAGGWPLFGSPPDRPAAGAASIGFAIAAPVLRLAEGQRRVVVRVQATPDSFAACWRELAAAELRAGRAGSQPLLTMFRAQATGPAGWVPLVVERVVADPARHCLTWTLQLDGTQPAVVGYAAARHAGPGPLATTQPVLRLLLNPQAPEYGYSAFAGLRPVAVRVRVRVRQMLDFRLSSPQGELSTKAPFYPFGARPQVGSFLQLDAPELLGKKLRWLQLALTWQNLPPKGFAAHYQSYSPVLQESDFAATVSYAANNAWKSTAPQRLFHDHTAAARPLVLKLTNPGYLGPAPDGAGPLRVALTTPADGFGIDLYPAALAYAVYNNARYMAPPPPPKDAPLQPVLKLLPLPLPPFVPQLSRVALSYQAQETFRPDQCTGPTQPAAFYHLSAFAGYEPATLGPVQLLPALPHEGTLFVGLSPGAAGQLVDLVFDLTVPADAAGPVSGPKWAYLDQDVWQPVDLDPATHAGLPGFANTCRVRLQLPALAGTTHRLMPSGLCWLRATVDGGAATFGQLRAVHSQLVPAQRVGTGTQPRAPYHQPLPAGGARRLLKPLPYVKAVTQPVASYGGRLAEDQRAHYARVSEELRHRGRALTPWDYERLLLAQFPEVHTARCLTARQLPRPRVPGQVLVAVLPQPTLMPDNPLPLFGPGQLAAMQQYLQEIAPPMVRLRVCNPCYEQVQVCATLAFKAAGAGEPLGHVQQLEQDVRAFLSPWHPVGPHRGGFHVFALSDLRHFLTQRPYVAGITGLSVVKTAFIDGRHRLFDSARHPSEGLGPTVPWAVLASAAEHRFTLSPWPGSVSPTGIGVLTLGSDFIVACDF